MGRLAPDDQAIGNERLAFVNERGGRCVFAKGGSVVAIPTKGVGRMFEIIKKANRFSDDEPETT
jgi:hypothetical protein